jgi:hypothetical protein
VWVVFGRAPRQNRAHNKNLSTAFSWLFSARA